MRKIGFLRCGLGCLLLLWLSGCGNDGEAAAVQAGGGLCASDAVRVGTVCMDKYEASVWRVPPQASALLAAITQGEATLQDLRAGGATQVVPTEACAVNGNDCKGRIYAVSVAGVIPSSYVSWFQAQQACGNSGKRLPTNAEWQTAAAGTPDPGTDDGGGDCKVDAATGSLPVATGSRHRCVSAWGVFDMVGNLAELVADWVPRSVGCGGWGSFSDDFMCVVGADTTSGPGVYVRGGDFANGANAGVFAIFNLDRPFDAGGYFGFRCVR